MSKLSLGIIETLGLAAAVEAADACVKSANVKLVGYEFSKGSGMTVVKIRGDVGAVNAAIAAGEMAASRMTGVVATRIIARPSDQLEIMIENHETVGLEIEKVEEVEVKHETEIDEETQTEVTCNICGDPLCTRKKGDLKRDCIHYSEM